MARHKNSKDPKFHIEEMLEGAGSLIRVLVNTFISGFAFKIVFVIKGLEPGGLLLKRTSFLPQQSKRLIDK
jgi:hypothetical protein